MKYFITCGIIVCILAVTACDDKSKGVSMISVTLKGPNLKAMMPEGAKVEEEGQAVHIKASGLHVLVQKASGLDPKTIEQAKNQAAIDLPKEIKSEKLSDGFLLYYEGEQGKYFVVARRTIGGVDYRCASTNETAQQQANAIKICKSLSK